MNQCEDAEELSEAILAASEDGIIQGRKRPFDANKMAGYVAPVIAGSLPANVLTREFGIRQQALYIKYYEDLKKI